VPHPVLSDPSLRRALAIGLADLGAEVESLRVDQWLADLADLLCRPQPNRLAVSRERVRRAQAYLDAQAPRAVRSDELEAVTGLDRFALARQFRRPLGVSPHRYLAMRRLHDAQRRILAGQALVDVALATGFADQSHLSRQFQRAFGLPPGQWKRLVAP
jgi:AraC-like DNA-binding protein